MPLLLGIPILLVEDDAVARDALRVALGRGARVTEVNTLADALAALDDQTFECILLDLGLPDACGIEVLERFRAADADVAIVVLTEEDDAALGSRALQLGAQDYLSKPGLDSHVTARSVRYAIERQRAAAALRAKDEQLMRSQKMEALGRLAGGVAHDFNNLLTVITSFARAVRDSLADGDARRADLDEVLRASDAAARLTHELLAFSRVQVASPRVIDLGAELVSLGKMLRRMIGSDIELATVIAQGVWQVEMDAAQLSQVMVNLAVNARDAMPDGGRLTVRVDNVRCQPPGCQSGEYVAIEVEDTGAGMEPDTLDRVFDPFFTTKGEQGTGLGLATCFGIVQGAGGAIEVSSTVGAGTRFTIHLPRATREMRRPEPPPLGAPRTGGETLLVVEDHPAVLRMMERVLSGFGYHVHQARSAEDAIALLDRGDAAPDLVVTDVILPGMSGVELQRQLRVRAPELRFLFMSGFLGEDAPVELRTGQEAFLSKPFTPQQLLDAVDEVLTAGTSAKMRSVSPGRGTRGPSGSGPTPSE